MVLLGRNKSDLVGGFLKLYVKTVAAFSDKQQIGVLSNEDTLGCETVQFLHGIAFHSYLS